MSLPVQSAPAPDPAVGTLLANIRHGDMAARHVAVRQAVLIGTPAILPLGEVLGGADRAAARAAFEALKRIAHHAGRPGAETEAKAAAAHLVKLTRKDRPRQVRAEALYLLGCVGGASAVRDIAGLLTDPDVREDARMALERIPDRSAERALMNALRSASADFRPALMQSVRHRKIKPHEVGTVP